MQAELPIYSTAQIMSMTRDGLLTFFRQEGAPEGVTQDELKKTASEVLRQIIILRLEGEGRIRELDHP